jgi:hypothetical protein
VFPGQDRFEPRDQYRRKESARVPPARDTRAQGRSYQESRPSPQKSVCREKAANLPWEREQKPTTHGIPAAALFEADLVEGVFHRLAGDPDDSPERHIQLLRHFDCPRDRDRAEEQRQDCCRVTRREQAEAQKEEAQPEHHHHQQRNGDPNRVLLDQKPSRPRDRAEEL